MEVNIISPLNATGLLRNCNSFCFGLSGAVCSNLYCTIASPGMTMLRVAAVENDQIFVGGAFGLSDELADCIAPSPFPPRPRRGRNPPCARKCFCSPRGIRSAAPRCRVKIRPCGRSKASRPRGWSANAARSACATTAAPASANSNKTGGKIARRDNSAITTTASTSAVRSTTSRPIFQRLARRKAGFGFWVGAHFISSGGFPPRAGSGTKTETSRSHKKSPRACPPRRAQNRSIWSNRLKYDSSCDCHWSD